jgi:hypothetical protein
MAVWVTDLLHLIPSQLNVIDYNAEDYMVSVANARISGSKPWALEKCRVLSGVNFYR